MAQLQGLFVVSLALIVALGVDRATAEEPPEPAAGDVAGVWQDVPDEDTSVARPARPRSVNEIFCFYR